MAIVGSWLLASVGTPTSGQTVVDGRRRPNTSAASAQVLDQIVLSVSPDQVVGRPLSGVARLILLDENNDLLTDYDLSTNPIQLIPDRGALAPNILDDNALFSAGVIDFRPTGVRYQGRTGSVGILAVSGSISSTPVSVRFNGYDILKAVDASGDSIVEVFSNLLTSVRVVIQNNGNLLSDPSPSLKSYFLSGGGSVKTFFTPRANGLIDTITVDLPTENLPGGVDTLVLVLQSNYSISDSLSKAFDSVMIPVVVSIPVTFDFVEGSFKPDSVYAGSEFDISLSVAASGFTGSIDSTGVTIRLYDDTTRPALTTIFEGGAEAVDRRGDTIVYAGLVSSIDTAAGLQSGWYIVRVDYQLLSGDDRFALSEKYPDSIYLVAPASLTYVEGSLYPDSVPKGTEVSLAFDLRLDDQDLLEIDPATARFTVIGKNFSTTADLLISSNVLSPGVNHVRTDSFFVPGSELGNSLQSAASFEYRVPGLPNSRTFRSNLNAETVAVIEPPLVRILSVRVLAPNGPKVNTGQPFRIRCEISNPSTTAVESFALRLSSDGLSHFDSSIQVGPIEPADTGVYFFDVVAADEPSAAELFRVEIDSEGPDYLPPIDDVASVTIETPANLRFSVELPGVESGYVERGKSFRLVASLTNTGQAAVSQGLFRFTSHGVNLGIVDPLEDTISVNANYTLNLLAPIADTTFLTSLELVRLPLDLNDSLPADVDISLFEAEVKVASFDADLLVTAEPRGSNLVLPGGTKELFRLTMTNLGFLEVSTMQIQTVTLILKDAAGQPLDVRSILEVGNSGFYLGGVRVSTATAGQDKMVLSFQEMILAAGVTRSLIFRASIQQAAGEEFTIFLRNDAIQAVFSSGPKAGQPVAVETPSGVASVLEETYTSTAGASAEGSFVIRNNPFNPRQEVAEFQFYLPTPGEVEFRIFTLTGEEVMVRRYVAGELVTGPGEPFVTINWDGRNDRGNYVLNGVYVAMLRLIDSGDEALLKIAVIK